MVDNDERRPAAGAPTPTGAAKMLVTIYGHPHWVCSGLEEQALLVARTYLADLEAMTRATISSYGSGPQEVKTHVCERCGKNHYDHSRPATVVPPCSFKPQRTGGGDTRLDASTPPTQAIIDAFKRTIVEASREPSAIVIARNMAESPDNWPPMRVKQVAETMCVLLDALKLAESVYRQNCVTPGEPSTVLDAMQAAIKQAGG